MYNELPPQFLDDNNEEICPSCIGQDACLYGKLVDGLVASRAAQLQSLELESVKTELAIQGVEATIRRLEVVDRTHATIENILAQTCLRYALNLKDYDT